MRDTEGKYINFDPAARNKMNLAPIPGFRVVWACVFKLVDPTIGALPEVDRVFHPTGPQTSSQDTL